MGMSVTDLVGKEIRLFGHSGEFAFRDQRSQFHDGIASRHDEHGTFAVSFVEVVGLSFQLLRQSSTAACRSAILASSRCVLLVM